MADETAGRLLVRMEATLAKFERQMRHDAPAMARRGARQVERELSGIGRGIDTRALGQSFSQMMQSMSAGGGFVRSFSVQLADVTANMNPLAMGIGAIAGVALPLLASRFLDTGDEAEDAQKRFDEFRSSLSGVRDLAETAGTPLSELRKEFGAMADEVRRAAEYLTQAKLSLAMEGLETSVEPIRAAIAAAVEARERARQAMQDLNRENQPGADPARVQVYRDAFEGLSAAAVDAASEIGLVPEQVADLDSAFRRLSAAQTTEDLALAASNFLDTVRELYPNAVLLPPEIAKAADYANSLLQEASRTTEALAEAGVEADNLADPLSDAADELEGAADDTERMRDAMREAARAAAEIRLETQARGRTGRRIAEMPGDRGYPPQTFQPEGAYPNVTAGPGGFVGVAGAGRGYTDVRLGDGTTQRREGSRAWRNNNPGNIEYGDFAIAHGAIGSDGRFAVFPTLEMGRAAKEALLFESRGYRGLTLGGAINRWAPPFENDTGAYAGALARAAGVGVGTPMSALNADQRRAVLAEMERVEGFRPGRVNGIAVGGMTEGAAGQALDAATEAEEAATRTARTWQILNAAGREAEFERVLEGTADAADEFATRMDAGTDAVTDLFMAFSGGADDAKEALGRLLLQMAAVQAQNAVTGLGESGGFLGNLIAALGGALTPTKPGKLASGTASWRGGMSWVGEHGPELVNLPAGSQVIPSGTSRSMAGGGAPVIHIDARGAQAGVAEQIEASMRRWAPTIQAGTMSRMRRSKTGWA